MLQSKPLFGRAKKGEEGNQRDFVGENEILIVWQRGNWEGNAIKNL